MKALGCLFETWREVLERQCAESTQRELQALAKVVNEHRFEGYLRSRNA